MSQAEGDRPPNVLPALAPPKPSTGDHVHTAVRIALGLVPVAGEPVEELAVGHIVPAGPDQVADLAQQGRRGRLAHGSGPAGGSVTILKARGGVGA